MAGDEAEIIAKLEEMGEREVRRLEANGGFPIRYYPFVTDWLAELDDKAISASSVAAAEERAAALAQSAASVSQAEATLELARHARNANRVASAALVIAIASIIVSVLAWLHPHAGYR
ncbi:MAG: hypothetical protein ACREEW_15450 [Caulobacteraceae bacterium]